MLFEKVKIHFILFVSKFDLTDKLKVATTLKPIFIEWNLQETILPLPPEALGEIPRIIFQNYEGTIEIKVSISRIDIIFITFIDFEKIINVIESLNDLNLFEINRLSYVPSFHSINLNESSAIIIKKQFFKENIFIDASDIQIASMKNIDVNNFKTNFWIKIFSLRETNNPSSDKAIGVDMDINTVISEKYLFNKESTSNFYKQVDLEANKQLDLLKL